MKKKKKKKSKSHKCYKCNISLKRSIKFFRRLLLNICSGTNDLTVSQFQLLTHLLVRSLSLSLTRTFYPSCSVTICGSMRQIDREIHFRIDEMTAIEREKARKLKQAGMFVSCCLGWIFGVRFHLSAPKQQQQQQQ